MTFYEQHKITRILSIYIHKRCVPELTYRQKGHKENITQVIH